MSEKANWKLIEGYINKGLTVKEIALETGYSEGTIRKHAKDNGVKISSRKSTIDNNVLNTIAALIDGGKTNKEIAVILNMSPTTVRKYTYKIGKNTNSVREKPLEKNIELTDIQLEVLYGSLLGDASIGMQWNEARVSFNQGGDQEAYFDYKCSFFKSLLGKVSKTDRYDKRTNKLYHKYAVRLKCHKYFTRMYNELYPNGVKTVSKEWLDKITPRGLAFWYMDDGTNNGVLATNSFSYEECLLIQTWFKERYNIDVTIQHQKNKSGIQYLIYIKSCSRSIFYKLVKPYIIPEMEYKFKNWIP